MVFDVVINKCCNEKIAVIITLGKKTTTKESAAVHDKAIMPHCLLGEFISLSLFWFKEVENTCIIYKPVKDT